MAEDEWEDEDDGGLLGLGAGLDLEPEPEPEPESEDGVGAGELATCLRVLRALEGQTEPFLQSRRYRDVRAAVARLGRTMQQKMYDGKSPEEYIRWSVKAQIARDAERRLKQRDADKVEKTQLRAARLQRLAALQEEQGQGSLLALSAVPDGAVEFRLRRKYDQYTHTSITVR